MPEQAVNEITSGRGQAEILTMAEVLIEIEIKVKATSIKLLSVVSKEIAVGVHNSNDKCPVSGKICNYCKKRGHFINV